LRLGATTIPNVDVEALVARWRALDAMPQVETAWLPDHTFKGWLSTWAVLPTLARETRRVRVGSLVSPLTRYEPSELAANARKLGDRAELGVGSGGDWRRFESWTDELAALIDDVPLTVGGAGRTALRVAAKHASRWSYSPWRDETRDDARRLGRELNEQLDALTDRSILRSVLIAYPFRGEDETPFDELVEAWSDAGFEELVVDYPGPFLAAP
jgi:alkanesulfonate monooxygenase SsuD/methylene tetrahydromethanopterin reductase-like flavin-dependent oxidoreductase (luciferase family)